MVQKYQSPVRVYKYPFELVMAAYEKRFPTCKMIPVFLGSEIMSEFKSEDGAIHSVERRCKLNVDAPYLLKKIVGVDCVYFIQKNHLDKRGRTLKISARNESFATRVVINENCQYFVHPENVEWTCFEQDASLDIKSFFGFESTVEKLAIKQYEINIKKGKEVIQYYLNEIISQGVSNIPPPFGTEDTQLPDRALHFIASSANQESGSGGHSSAMAAGDSSICSAVPPSPTSKLERSGEDLLNAEYIERYLGADLSPAQESALIQLRKWLGDTHKGKMPYDAHLLRFLRARDFNVDKTRDMLHQSLLWRKQHQIDKILNTYKTPLVLQEYIPGGWHCNDKDGRPVYLLRLGEMDIKGSVKSVGEEGVVKHVLYIAEEGLHRTEEQTRRTGHPVSTWSLIVDLEGLSIRHLWRPGVRTLLRIIEIMEANYPETMGRLVIVRAPRVFPVLWTLVHPFIDDHTRDKFVVFGDFDCKRRLEEYLHNSDIPNFLGGPAICADNITQVQGHVPKSLYMVDFDESKDNPPLCTDTIYQSAHVTKGSPHEVLVQVIEKGCVLTWDFDVMKGDCVFTVMRSRQPVSAPDPSCTTSPCPGADSMGHSGHHVTISSGIEVFNVEPPLICHDGDSIQGTHVTQQAGSYILRWKLYEPRSKTSHAKGEHHTSVPFELPSIIAGPKSKVMYFYELLNSKDFKGSMVSLQSCQSSVSVNSDQRSVCSASDPSR